MAHIDALIDKIADVDLRKALREQVDTLLQRRSFGLVFQDHKPEVVELPNYTVRAGCVVHDRTATVDTGWYVESVQNGVATISAGDLELTVPVTDLVVVRDFGEAIYPGLKAVGRLTRSEGKPFHAVINAENFHALETLRYAYEGKVDAIYIDPPYNTGAKDWKYNNDYVDGVDEYRHSKWLAFMERRLELAKKLLNPADSVLVVTIDENEVHHLGVLLEQIFPDAVRQMVTIAINGKGVAQAGKLSRVEEYAFFVFVGAAQANPLLDNLYNESSEAEVQPAEDPWSSLLRRGTAAARADRPGMFFPFFVDPVEKRVVEVGDAVGPTADRSSTVAPEGTVAVWPIRTDNSEGRWQVAPDGARRLLTEGYLKVGAYNRRRDQWAIKYLFKAQRDRVASGDLHVTGRAADGSVILEERARRLSAAKTIWSRSRHNAGSHGSNLLRSFIPGRSFPFPKSLYAVVDTLRVMVGNKPDALVLDFFGGSGTTAHATAYLNAVDGGRRRSIVVTNNEVSVDEARTLRAAGIHPGDEEWEALGIFRYITWPRIEAAFSGVTPEGAPISGAYLDGAPFADGLKENVEFFELTYEDPDLVSMGRAFTAVAPLLWLRAGASGPRIEEAEGAWQISEDGSYGVLFDEERWRDFVEAIADSPALRHAFVVTNSRSVYLQVCAEAPGYVEVTQLYDDYLRSFRINTEVRS